MRRHHFHPHRDGSGIRKIELRIGLRGSRVCRGRCGSTSRLLLTLLTMRRCWIGLTSFGLHRHLVVNVLSRSALFAVTLLRSLRNIVDAVALTLAHFSRLGGESLSCGELERGRELPGEAVLLLMVQPLPLLPAVYLLYEAHLVRLRLEPAAREV